MKQLMLDHKNQSCNVYWTFFGDSDSDLEVQDQSCSTWTQDSDSCPTRVPFLVTRTWTRQLVTRTWARVDLPLGVSW